MKKMTVLALVFMLMLGVLCAEGTKLDTSPKKQKTKKVRVIKAKKKVARKKAVVFQGIILAIDAENNIVNIKDVKTSKEQIIKISKRAKKHVKVGQLIKVRTKPGREVSQVRILKKLPSDKQIRTKIKQRIQKIKKGVRNKMAKKPKPKK